MKNVMVDLETLGNGSNAVIVSIGAVEFDETGLGNTFYRVVSPQSCVDKGMVIDASTVMWWMQQSDAARKALLTPDAMRIEYALTEFSVFAADCSAQYVWGNGATFDNVILSNAYNTCGLLRPWSYRDDRCYRTLRALYPHVSAGPSHGTAHNALDDAVYQALHAVAILKEMNNAQVQST